MSDWNEKVEAQIKETAKRLVEEAELFKKSKMVFTPTYGLSVLGAICTVLEQKKGVVVESRFNIERYQLRLTIRDLRD